MKISFLAFCVFALAACGTVKRSSTDLAVEREFGKRFVQERAAFDLNCGAGKLDVAYLGTSGETPQYGARGCDHQCTYLVSCDRGGSCQALDTRCDTQTAPPPTAPTPTPGATP